MLAGVLFDRAWLLSSWSETPLAVALSGERPWGREGVCGALTGSLIPAAAVEQAQ